MTSDQRQPVFTACALACAAFFLGPVLSIPALAQSGDPSACIERILDRHAPDHHFLSVIEGPSGWLLESAPGTWGQPLGPSVLREISCASGDARQLRLPDVLEIGEPWYDAASDRLYFTSRTVGIDGIIGDRDIFVSARIDGEWQPPERMPEPINSAGDEYSPVVRGQRIWFASARDETNSQLFVAATDESGWQAEALPPVINSAGGEWNLWVSEDEDMVLFEASGRSGAEVVAGDIFGAARDAEGRWRPALVLPELNAPNSDFHPRVIGSWLIHAQVSGTPPRARPVATSLGHVRAMLRAPFNRPLAVANRSSHTIGVVDVVDGRPLAELPTGRGPNLLALSPNGRRLATAAYGIFPRPHSTPVRTSLGWVTDDGGELHLWAVGDDAARDFGSECSRPHGVAWSDDNRLWVTCEDRESVQRFTFGGGSPDVETMPTGRQGAHVVAWDARRNQALVSHTRSGGLWLQPADGSRGRFIEIGSGAEAIEILPDGDRALVTVGPAHEIALVDLVGGEVVDRIRPGCQFPIDFATDYQERIWVACLSSRTLLALDPLRFRVVDEILLEHGPLNIVAHPLEPLLYVSLPRRNAVIEVTLDTLVVTRTFEVGIEPNGLVLLPPGSMP